MDSGLCCKALTFVSNLSGTITSKGWSPPRLPTRPSYWWSPVPKGKAEAIRYVDTALAWRHAGSAEPFAIVRMSDDLVIGSTRFWNPEYCPGRAATPCTAAGLRIPAKSSRTQAEPPCHPDWSQHRGQAAHAENCLRNVARPPGSACTRTPATSAREPRSRASADRWRGSTRRSDGCRFHPSRLRTVFDPGIRMARCETAPRSACKRTALAGIFGYS